MAMMTPKRIRSLHRLAQTIGAVLQCDFTGTVWMFDMEEPEQGALGGVEITNTLAFVGADDPDGEGWEHFSAPEAKGLSRPRFVLESGDVVSVKQAMRIAEEIQAKGGESVVEEIADAPKQPFSALHGIHGPH